MNIYAWWERYTYAVFFICLLWIDINSVLDVFKSIFNYEIYLLSEYCAWWDGSASVFYNRHSLA